MVNQREKGQEKERLVADWLQSKGLVLVQMNFHCKMGEIDLIMKDQDSYVFIEVRYRKSQLFGGARESITAAKRRKIERASCYFLSRYSVLPPCRFDVVLMEGNAPPEWIQNAWDVGA